MKKFYVVLAAIVIVLNASIALSSCDDKKTVDAPAVELTDTVKVDSAVVDTIAMDSVTMDSVNLK